MTDLETAQKYLPVFMADRSEPFCIQMIGYSVYKNRQQSKSCRRVLDPQERGCEFVVEYAVFFDFDIQHLYDLEHVFVYVNGTGQVVDGEGSFHGKFLKCMFDDKMSIKDETHPIIYMQPGKHAMMSSKELFHLFIGFYDVCNKDAGQDGFLIAPMFEGILGTDEVTNQVVKDYIRTNFSFCPTEEYIECRIESKQLVTYAILEKKIIERMKYLKSFIISNMRKDGDLYEE